MAHRFRLVEGYDLTARLGRVRVPALVVAGDRDLLVSPASLAALADGLPDGRVVRLPGCGHLAFATHPEQVAGAVAGFLDAVACVPVDD
jgi:pimeloyl-ACP methyl ester carboxylesterase